MQKQKWLKYNAAVFDIDLLSKVRSATIQQNIDGAQQMRMMDWLLPVIMNLYSTAPLKEKLLRGTADLTAPNHNKREWFSNAYKWKRGKERPRS
jgi:hypothetical protein